MENQNKQLTESQVNAYSVDIFASVDSFELAQRGAKLLSQSKLVPKAFQNNQADCVIALQIARRLGADPLMVMQNLHVIHGKPNFSAQFVTAAINMCGKFSPLRFRMENNGTKCTAYAIEKATGETLEGVEVTMEMAKMEGWIDKAGSKWKTIPKLMLRYRAATFFGRLYAPEILMGFQTSEELQDVGRNDLPVSGSKEFDIELPPDEVLPTEVEDVKEDPIQPEQPEEQAPDNDPGF